MNFSGTQLMILLLLQSLHRFFQRLIDLQVFIFFGLDHKQNKNKIKNLLGP